MNLFIESIEGGTYLAATGDGQQRDYIRCNKNMPRAFHCLNEIKEHLNGQEFEKVWLKQSTPYEEMCGLDSADYNLEMEIDWH